MQQPQKDQTKQPGLTSPADITNPDAGKDVDELVHEQSPELPEPTSEADVDDLVHERGPLPTTGMNTEIDEDDAVHQAGGHAQQDGTGD